MTLSFCLLFAAQPLTPKLDDSWWAYKDVVQGSFVPGKTHPPCYLHSHIGEMSLSEGVADLSPSSLNKEKENDVTLYLGADGTHPSCFWDF